MNDNRQDEGRRQCLRLWSRQALALAAWQVFAPRAAGAAVAAPAFPSDPFTLGVASGFPGPDRVVIWTRLAPRPQADDGGMPPQPVRVQWELAADAQFRHGLRSGTVETGPQRAHSVHVRVDGLAPGREWFYRFRAGDASSPIGRTRTAPPPDQAGGRLRLAVASCQHYEQGYYAVHREIAGSDVDLVLFLGDYIYEGHRLWRVREHETREPAATLLGYRRRYAHYKVDPQLQASHAAHPWVLMWDDHEVENDYAGEVSPTRLDRERFMRRRTAAYQAYLEHQPVDPGLLAAPQQVRLHGCTGWGQLADIWTLDERQYRSPQACDAGIGPGGGHILVAGCDGFGDGARTVLGADQERWIAAGLRDSRARWQLVGHGSPLSAQNWRTPVGPITISDSWDGYTAARRRLLQAAEDAAGQVVFLAGDVHRHMAARLRMQPDDERSPVVAAEFVTSSISSSGLRQSLVDAVRRAHPDLLYARGDERGYLRLDVQPDRIECDMRATPHPVPSADAPLHTQARFEVRHGEPGPVPR